MKMSRERARELAPIIKAYGEGAEIQYLEESSGRWVTHDPSNFLASTTYRIKPALKKRPMTRGEVLYMVTTTPGMVVRHGGAGSSPASNISFFYPVEEYEYTIIDESGDPIDGWHKFEKEVNDAN